MKKFIYKTALSFVLCLMSCACLQAQEIKKSIVVKKEGDKSYYIHKIEKGQTLEAIAKAYNMKIDVLLVANPDAIDGINPGQELKVPCKSANQTTGTKDVGAGTGKAYVVKDGDTYYSISRDFEVWVEDIKKMNPALRKEGLKAGLTIRIPDRKKKIIK
ncbi:MAG: LysM peptidoglycan-binding domain-containing protein [Bacteroidia bacterium]